MTSLATLLDPFPAQQHRRRALIGAVAAMLVPVPAWVKAAPVSDVDDAATLAAFVDTLLPADDLSPAASTLGIHDEIADFAADVTGLAELIQRGAAWLNATGGPPFADLTEVDRIRIIEWMSEADRQQAPFRFYEVVRMLAVEFYYARPEAIGGFPLNPAPQPRGYPPPWS